jgi:ornithine cyclodeaminase
VLEDADVRDGTHVNAIGSSSPRAREIETALVLRADVFVDSVASAVAEAGDLQPALQANAALESRLRELGAVIVGRAAGRRDDAAVTLFKSVGLAIEDVVAGCHVAAAAEAAGVGARFELAGGPHTAS